MGQPRAGPLIQAVVSTGHCHKERRRVPVRHLAFSNGSEKWVCLDCGSCKVSKIVEGTEFPALVREDTCHYCGEYFDPKDKYFRPSKDHIIPKALGGPDAPWNYTKAHAICNTRKKDDWPTCPCTKCTMAVQIFRRNLDPYRER